MSEPELEKMTVEKLQAIRGYIEGVALSKAQLQLQVELEDHTRWTMTITSQAIVTIGPDGSQTAPRIAISWTRTPDGS